MIRVLFVCLGNICRSPMAEGSFINMINDAGLADSISCDSAGTSSYHIGELADERMRNTAKNHGIELTHRARQLEKEDFNNFDYIVAMDAKNHHNIELMAKSIHSNLRAKVLMMREFDPIKGSKDVPDPYFGGIGGFEEVFDILERSNKEFLNYLLQEHHLK